MSTHHRMGRILRVGLGLGLTAAFAVAGGCAATAPAGEPDPAGGQAAAEPTETLFNGTGIYKCMSGSAGPSTLVVNDDGTCFIIHGVVAPGATPTYCIGPTCAACWSIAKNTLGCTLPQ